MARGPKPTMSHMWEMIRFLRENSPAARTCLKPLYARSETVPEAQLWYELRMAARATIAERGKGLSQAEFAEYNQFVVDWPIMPNEDRPDRAKVSIEFTLAVLDEIKAEATLDGMPRATWIRNAVLEKLRRREAERAEERAA